MPASPLFVTAPALASPCPRTATLPLSSTFRPTLLRSSPHRSRLAHAARRSVTCHSHCGSNHAPPVPPTASSLPPSTFQSILLRMAQLQQSAAVAAAAAVLLMAAAAAHMARLPLPLVRTPLLTAAALTALPALLGAAARLVRSRGTAIDVDTLMSVAAALLLASGALFEGALLAVLYAVSHAAEQMVQTRAQRALRTLRDAAPATAWRLPAPTLSAAPLEVPVARVAVGDFLLVRAGELLPCDAVVVAGRALVSTQVLTGEAVPRAAVPGDELPAGARAEDAPLAVRVTRIGAESSMARIARLVTAAQENRPRVTVFFDSFGRLYARTVLVASALIAILLPLVARAAGRSVAYVGRGGSLARGLGFLVTASPCALLVGGPVAYVAALSCCARMGVLAKSGAKSLEAASRVSHVVFDKTGTLTTGKLTLESAALLPEMSFANVRVASESTSSGNGVLPGEILIPQAQGAVLGRTQHALDELELLEKGELSRIVAAAAALERGAVHPIATAVQERAVQLGGQFPDVSNTKVIAGQGVEGVLSFDNKGDFEIAAGRLGSPSFVLGKLAVSAFRSVTEEASSRGETISVLEIGTDRYLLRLRDELREESADVVSALKGQGLVVSVLTGDAEGAAQFVSSAVGSGIQVVSNATPEQKLGFISSLGKKLGRQNSGVLMVGDGVNDAAALAASLVGVSCGLNSATAVHAADVVLMREDLRNVAWFLRKARATEAIVRQNLVIALGLMVLATGACVSGAVPLWLAVTLHEGGTVLVGLNGLRLLRE